MLGIFTLTEIFGCIDGKAEEDIVVNEDLLLNGVLGVQRHHISLYDFCGSDACALHEIVIDLLQRALSLYLVKLTGSGKFLALLVFFVPVPYHPLFCAIYSRFVLIIRQHRLMGELSGG